MLHLNGRPLQLLATISAGLSSISDGMHSGWTAPAMPILENSTTSPVDVSETDETWLESIYMIAGFLGLPLSLLLVDRIGRKLTIIIASLCCLTAWIILATAVRIELYYVARFLTGMTEDIAFITAPMYVAEIADQKIRGFLTALVNTFTVLGILIVYTVVPIDLIYAPAIGASLIVVQLATFVFMPESPYYYLEKGFKDRAMRSLKFFRSKNAASSCDKELEEISKFASGAKNLNCSDFRQLRTKHNLKSLTICIILTAAQNFSGYSVILMNVHTILSQTQSYTLDSTLSAILYAVAMLLAGIMASLLVDKVGRKPLTIASALLSSLCMLSLAIHFHVAATIGVPESLDWLPLAACMAYGFCFKAGLGIVPEVLVAELFSMDVKVIGMCVSDAVYTISGFVTIDLFYWLRGYGYCVPFYVFGLVAFCSGLYTYWCVPETKGKTLEEIQDMLKS